MNTAVLYRSYDLPWTPHAIEERRLRRILGAVLGVFIACGVVIPLLPTRAPPQVPPALPERVVEFLLERPAPKVLPPPPPQPLLRPIERPVERSVETARVPVQPVADSRPVAPVSEAPPRPDARQRAQSSGVLALADQLAALRELGSAASTRPVTRGAATRSSVDRSVLNANASAASGGIEVARAGSVSQGAPALAGHQTARVEAASAAPAVPAQRNGASDRASRSREEIEIVFDRNKSAIYSIYSRALRDAPALQGKVVLEMTIAPTGEVTEARVVSSELGDAELERKLVARVKMFRFEDKDVAVMTTTKPIEFFPG